MIRFIRKFLATAIFVVCIAPMSATVPEQPLILDTIQQVIDSIDLRMSPSATQQVIEFLSQHKQNPSILEKLNQSSAKTREYPYFWVLYEHCNALQKSTLLNWLEEVACTPEQIEVYFRTIRFDKSTSSYIQKIVDLLQNHPHIFEKLVNKTYQLDDLYRNASEKQQASLKDWFCRGYERHTGKELKQSITQLLLFSKIIPNFARPTHGWSNNKRTQSKSHFFEHYLSTLCLLDHCSDEVRKMLVTAYKKEQEERAKGNYVFYHAQRWDLHFSTDIYKQLWNLTKGDSVGDDFTFLRFNQQAKAYNDRTDYLFMNHALFGNLGRDGSCTLLYFITNRSINSAMFPAQTLFKDFKLSKYYTKYKFDFDKLEQLHQQASTSSNLNQSARLQGNTTGNLMLISIPADKLSIVRPVHPESNPRKVKINGIDTADTKTILDALISNPKVITNSDVIEYSMPLTTEYALDPKNGPRFYQFNAADPEKLKAYEQARDALFAKIRQDFEADQKAKQK